MHCQTFRALALSIAFVSFAGCTKVATNSDAGNGALPSAGVATTDHTTQRHAYTHPHEFRFAVAADIKGLNPLTGASQYEAYLAQLCMAWLIKTDSHGDATVPELITEIPSLTNGGISKDGKTLTFHIRHGLKWSDGAPFDADDVVFSTNQVNNPKNNVVSRDGWDQIVKIDEPDKFTVVYHLKAPYSSFAVTFFSSAGANPSVLPKHLLAKYENLNDVPYNALPVGIGPFKYESWKRADSVTMVRNPLYFRGAPKLRSVIFKIIPDRNTTMEQMRTHEIDAWLPISAHFYPQVAAIPGITMLSDPNYTFDHLDFNLGHSVVNDISVRRALRYATPRKLINDKIQNGLFVLGESPVTPASHFHLDLPLVPYDLAKANAQLDAAGWKRGADGVRAKKGLRLDLAFATSAGNPDTDTSIELIRASWKQIGVQIDVKRYLASQYFAPFADGGIVYAGKFDVALFGWGSDPNEDQSNLYACYRFPPDGQNDVRWCDRAATAAMDRAKTSYDQAKRKIDIDVVQRAVYDAVPTIILDTRKELIGYNADLTGWKPNPVAPFDDMLNVDI